MFRALSLLAVAAGLIAPAWAAQQTIVTQETVTTITIPAAEYERWQRMGFTTQDIFYAYNAAAAANVPVAQVFDRRMAGRSWDQIATELRVPVYRVYGVAPGVSLRAGMVPGERIGIVAGERIEITRDGARPAVGARVFMVPALMTPYTAYERPLPEALYKNGAQLTPRDYRRYRAMGFKQEEVFLIGNAVRVSGLEARVFADAIYRGMTPREIALEFGITQAEMTRVQPEWRTREWAAAVNEPVYTRDRLGIWW